MTSAFLHSNPASDGTEPCRPRASIASGMVKRTRSVTASVVSAPATPKKKSRPTRAAAQRASSALQGEARHVESFEASPTKAKKKPTSKPARKTKTKSLHTTLTTMKNNSSTPASQRNNSVADVIDGDENVDIIEGDDDVEQLEHSFVYTGVGCP